MSADPHLLRKTRAYKHAFEAYMRTGEPIGMAEVKARATSEGEERSTTRYIWRTQGDGKVRASHRANDGKIFSWDDPPPTGHPGEDFGCRCWAEAYEPEVSESMTLVMSGISDSPRVWSYGLGGDFSDHYFNGDGVAVRLRDTGHLRRVVDEYQRQVEFRLLGQIANAAREAAGSSFTYGFYRPYKMKPIVFDLGDTVIGGVATGSSRLEKTGALKISGTCEFYLRDKFENPLGFGFDLPGGKIYDIFDDWRGRFSGIVNVN